MAESATPVPAPRRRRRWLRRILAGLLIVIVSAPIAHFLWGRYERRRLNALIAEFHAAGEPVLPADFNHPHVDDPENPVPELRAAASALPTEPDWKQWMRDDDPAFPLTPAEAKRIHQIVQENAPALSHLKAAMRKRGAADWQIVFRSPVIQVPLPELTRQHELAKLLLLSVIDAHQRGDDVAAVERLRQMLMLGRTTYTLPLLLGHLVGVACTAKACDAASAILPDLRIGLADGQGTRSVRPEQIRALIGELLDDRDQFAGLRYGIATERMMSVDSATWAVSGAHTFTTFLLEPQTYGDAGQLLMDGGAVMRTVGAATWPACERALPTFRKFTGSQVPFHLILSMFRTDWARPMEQDYRCITERRLNAIALAARWYAVDHDQRLPAAIEDLAPKYLPALPPDPFAIDAPLRYRATPEPLVWSVGLNGTNEGGSERAMHPDRSLGGSAARWDQEDFTLHLTRRPRRMPDEPPGDGSTGAGPKISADAGPTTGPASRPAEYGRPEN